MVQVLCKYSMMRYLDPSGLGFGWRQSCSTSYLQVAWSFQLYRFCGRRRACGALTSGFRDLDLNDFVFKPSTLNPRGRVAVDLEFLHRGHFGGFRMSVMLEHHYEGWA